MQHRTASRVPILIAVATLLAGGIPTTAHVAHADASQCPVEEVCVWSGSDYSGTFTSIQDETCDDATVGSALDNDPDTLQELRVYPQAGCRGTPVVIKAKDWNNHLAGHSYMNWHDPRDPAGP
jgi:Peptidase inhibitor family I36